MDDCTAETYFFEGAEKLLEIWFGCSGKQHQSNQQSSPQSNSLEPLSHTGDLRKIPRGALESILKLVNCQIISFKRSDTIDAYVLSESSMFVSKDRFIIKTCGRTTLLQALEPIIFMAKKVAGFDEILDVFYSRKNFLRPDLQPTTYQDFSLESDLLDSYFEEGAAYCMGQMNRDHWYLYTLSSSIPSRGVKVADQTFEVMMHDLDPDKMHIFTKERSINGRNATEMSGIDKLIPGAVIDEFLFDPCGYSMNGLIKGGYYMTIHITPEEGFSYASFETNYSTGNYADLLCKLIKTFAPGSFIVTLFTNGLSTAGKLNMKDFTLDALSQYHMRDFQVSRVKNYDVTYGSFAKAPS